MKLPQVLCDCESAFLEVPVIRNNYLHFFDCLENEFIHDGY